MLWRWALVPVAFVLGSLWLGAIFFALSFWDIGVHNTFFGWVPLQTFAVGFTAVLAPALAAPSSRFRVALVAAALTLVLALAALVLEIALTPVWKWEVAVPVSAEFTGLALGTGSAALLVRGQYVTRS